MDEAFKTYAFILLGVRALIDLTLAGIIYYQGRVLVISLGFLLLCSVFYWFLYFGIRNEEFHGRYGRRVILWREPVGYWFVVAFLILFHLVITVLTARAVHW